MIIIRLFFLLIIFVSANCIYAQKPNKPKLILQITGDQLRGDLLFRYQKAFTGGFKRLLQEGFQFRNAITGHAITNSLPGHVTIATGLHPGHHGIVNSAWAVKNADGTISSFFPPTDSNYKIIDHPELPGASPKDIIGSSLAEWIQWQDPKSKTVCISSGEFASLLHAVRAKGDVYWYSPDAGCYVTSAFYKSEYPEWVNIFNSTTLQNIRSDSVWQCSVPERFFGLSSPDVIKEEYDNIHVTFPHSFSKEKNEQSYNEWYYFTPKLDSGTLLLSIEAITNLNLGNNGHTDYLNIVVSATDHIGHRYGPISLEQFDNLLRLDRELGRLFDFLDKRLGKGNYIVALNADHGAPDLPVKGHSVYQRLSQDSVDMFYDAVRTAIQPYIDLKEIHWQIKTIAKRFSFIDKIYFNEDFSSSAANDETDPYFDLFKNNYNPQRWPASVIFPSKGGSLARYGAYPRLRKGLVPEGAPVMHGGPYEYDQNVTMIFYGWGIKKGTSNKKVDNTSIASTLAKLAGVAYPENLDGKPIQFK